jgi:hypothetical protein
MFDMMKPSRPSFANEKLLRNMILLEVGAMILITVALYFLGVGK